MRRRYMTVDVFTDRAFGGNPLAVVLDAEGLTDAQMQAVAREFGYSETTFVLPPADAAHSARVRIFTPGTELPFAGHPNIGTAFVLGATSSGAADRLVFEEAAGLVPLTLLREGGVVCGAELTAPRPLVTGAPIEAGEIAVCLGLDSGDLRTALHPPRAASVGLPFVIVELAAPAVLERVRPDLAALRRLLPRDGADAVFLHAVDPHDADLRHARMFSPLDGIGEDPATGSAAAALAALLASLRPVDELDLALTVRQGEAMGRPSTLLARVEKRAGQAAAVRLQGRCVAMMEGSLTLAGAG